MSAAKTLSKSQDPGEASRQYEQRFESLIELSSDWYWEQDEAYRFTLIQGSKLKPPSFDAGSLLGTTRWDHGATPVGDGGLWDKHKAVLEARQPFVDFLYKRTDANGERYVSASGQPIFDAKKRFKGYRGIAKNVTESKRAEELLRLEHTVTRALAEADSAPAALKAAMQAICETDGWECGRYFGVDEKAKLMRFVEAWSVPGEMMDRFIAKSREVSYGLGDGLLGATWQSGQPLWIADIAKDGRVHVGTARKMGMHGAFFFPVTSEGKTIGAISFHSRRVREPEERLLQAIHVIGSQIGQFMQRKRAEEEERRFRAAIDVSADLVLLVDPASMRYVDANETACRVLGYSREELLAMGPHDLYSASREELAETYRRLIAGDQSATATDGWYRRKDGSRFAFESFRRVVPAAKGHVIVVVARDVGERKRSEQLLKLEHTVTRSLAEADSAPAALEAAIRAVCETEGWECGRYFRPDGNAGVLRMGTAWGVSVPEIERYIAGSRDLTYAPGVGLVGRVWQEGQPIWVPDLYEDARTSQAGLARASGMHGAFVFPVVSEGKTIGVLAFNSRAVRQPEERLLQSIHVIGSQIGQFVQRKEAEKVLRKSEESFRALTELSSDMYWTQDSEHRFTSFSGSNKTLPLRLIGKRRWDESSFNMTEADWAAHKAIMDARQPFRDVELGRRSEAGETFWVSISGAPVFDDSGTFTGYRGVSKNITARKREDELVRLEHAVTRCLADAENLSDALKAAIRAVCESQGWECGRYFYADEKAGVLRFGEAWGIADPAIERYIDLSRESTYPLEGKASKARAWRTREPLWTSEMVRRGGMAQSTLGGARDAFAFAVVAEGKALGVLSFTNREVREPDARLLQAARVIGSQVGQFVQRKQAEAVLRESEERFRSLTGLSSDSYWEQDDQHRFTSISGTGLERDSEQHFQRLGKTRWEQNYINMTPESWAAHIAVLDARRPFHDLELCRLNHSGQKIWINISGEPVFDALGSFKGYRGVAKDISGRKRDEERIQYLANHDALTSLPNRAMFNDVLGLALQAARRYRRSFAVLFLDLDRFKIINDTLGHEAGDLLLKEMAARLTHTVRSSDVVARLGGDEFVLLIQEVNEAKQTEAVARKILSALIKPMFIGGQECRVTASIGICMYPADAADEQALMKNADIAMYRAKEEGKNTYKFYSEKTNVHSFERLALETSLRRGLERSEFFLHYQAKLDLHAMEITGVEALLRWQHPDLGMVPPGQFIPLAEETGLIVPIGKWVLETACAQNAAWQKEGLPALRMAVNLSARQFADDNLLADIAAALEHSAMAPELLELELTESMVMQNSDRAEKVLIAIKKLGVRLAIDDFGVGYSSLTHLKRFPIDTLKVDRSFIRDIPQDSEDKAITEAIIAMGKSLKLTVVAEGVETLEQQAFLQSHDCDEMQGFYFSRPIASEQFAALLRQRLEAQKK